MLVIYCLCFMRFCIIIHKSSQKQSDTLISRQLDKILQNKRLDVDSFFCCTRFSRDPGKIGVDVFRDARKLGAQESFYG